MEVDPLHRYWETWHKSHLDGVGQLQTEDLFHFSTSQGLVFIFLLPT